MKQAGRPDDKASVRVQGFRKVNTIFFDGAGTLFRVRGSVGMIYSDIARRFGVDVSPEYIEDAFKKAFAFAPPLAFPGAIPSSLRGKERDWWRTLAAEVFKGIPFQRFDAFFEELFEYFRGSMGWELFPETQSVLEEVKGRGFRLGIISNFDSRIYDVCRTLRIFSLLDSITLSSEVGAAKPDTKIFKTALAKGGLKPEEALHIGDSLAEDVHGGRSAGLLSIFLDRTLRPKGYWGTSTFLDQKEEEKIDSFSGYSPSLMINDLNGIFLYLPQKK